MEVRVFSNGDMNQALLCRKSKRRVIEQVLDRVQPRHRGATASDAHAFGRQLSKELIDAGFREVTSRSSTSGPFLRSACSRANDMNTRRVIRSHRESLQQPWWPRDVVKLRHVEGARGHRRLRS